MRSLGSRRAALATGVAAVAAVALAGCSAGQVAETALKRPSNMGVNADNSDRSIVIRNLAVRYDGTAGYAQGANAPLQLGIYNQTKQAITVLVSSRPAENATESQGVVSAQAIGLVGGSATAATAPTASASPSASPSASASAAPDPAKAVRPARIEIAPLGSVSFLPGDAEELLAVGLSGKLSPGKSVNLVFEFSNGAQPLTLQAPVGIPLTPASRVPGLPHEDSEE